MSGGVIGIAPALVIVPAVAAAAVVVIGAGIAVALTVRAAQAGTEAAGRALERFGEEAERAARAQDDHEIRTRLWELAASAVVGVDQDLRLLRTRAAKAGVSVPLPSPLDLTGQALADVRAWAVRVGPALAEARVRVERAESARERRELLATLPTPPDGVPTAAELLARYQKALDTRRQPLASPAHDSQPVEIPRQVDKQHVQAEIDRILARLDIDAGTVERAEVFQAAARVTAQADPGTSRTYLDALARRVDRVVNPRIADRRDAASWLAALEHPMVVEAIGEAPRPLPPFLNAIDRLRAVLRGDAGLTPADRHDARQALAWVRKEVDRRRLLDVLAETFAGLGYAVTTGMQVHHTAALSVAQEGWRAEHSADVWVDERGGVQWRLAKLKRNATGDASRCEELNQSMRAIGAELHERGFDVEVTLPATPVAPVARYDGKVDDTSTTGSGDDARNNRYHDPLEENQ